MAITVSLIIRVFLQIILSVVHMLYNIFFYIYRKENIGRAGSVHLPMNDSSLKTDIQ